MSTTPIEAFKFKTSIGDDIAPKAPLPINKYICRICGFTITSLMPEPRDICPLCEAQDKEHKEVAAAMCAMKKTYAFHCLGCGGSIETTKKDHNNFCDACEAAWERRHSAKAAPAQAPEPKPRAFSRHCTMCSKYFITQSFMQNCCDACTDKPAIDEAPAPAPAHKPLLLEAHDIIHGARREAYGAVEESFAKVAGMWSTILGHPVTAREVALCMCALKLCREAAAHSRDNLVDLAGYAALADQVTAVKTQ